MNDQLIGMTQTADVGVIRAADKEKASELGYDLVAMASRGEDISEILQEVRK